MNENSVQQLILGLKRPWNASRIKNYLALLHVCTKVQTEGCTVWVGAESLNRNPACASILFLYLTHPRQECKSHFVRGGGDQKLSEDHVKELCLSESEHQRLSNGALLWCQTGKNRSHVECKVQSLHTNKKETCFFVESKENERDIYKLTCKYFPVYQPIILHHVIHKTAYPILKRLCFLCSSVHCT